jgi:predicted small lipoprotein YifL
MRFIPLLVSFSFLLAGCGMKGDLYLPSPTQQPPKQEAAKPAPQAESKQEQKQ